MAATKKKPFRFSSKDDLVLLTEVISQNPFASKESGRVWLSIADALNDLQMEVTARSCREHTLLLIEYFNRKITRN